LKQIEYLEIAPIESAAVQFVSKYYTRTDKEGNPYQMVLSLALDKEKAGTDFCEFPVYVPAHQNYHKSEHLKMLTLFNEGNPFVAVSLWGLKVYKTNSTRGIEYFGYADTFVVVENPAELLEEVL
jgi:hypothetical protein